jgi:hypothetical protein
VDDEMDRNLEATTVGLAMSGLAASTTVTVERKDIEDERELAFRAGRGPRNGGEKMKLTVIAIIVFLAASGCDDLPLSASDMEVSPSNEATSNEPEACFTADPNVTEIAEGATITLDAGCSARVTSQATYIWELGDGRTRTGPRIETRFRRAGSYLVRLLLEDQGFQSTATREIHVIENVLTACFDFGQVPWPCTFAFDASCSDGTITEYRWFFSGGPPVIGRFPDANRTTTVPQIEYSWDADTECMYFRPFERLVRLTVVDGDGNTSTVEEVVRFYTPI